MELLLATTNPHKLDGVREASRGSGVAWVGLETVAERLRKPLPPEPVEDADTFEANARTKAEAYAAWSGLPTASDDSGLVVHALDGAPGVHSARYAGVDGPRGIKDAANNAKLLLELERRGLERPDAAFACALVLVRPGSATLSVRGEVPGRIVTTPRGTHGFGYDPYFELDERTPALAGRTTAELTEAEKSTISHRGEAVRALLNRLLEEQTPAP